MGVIIRESIKTSVVNYVGVIIGTLNVLFIYTKYLSTDENGLYGAILSFPVVYAGFFNLGIPHMIVRFFNRFSDKSQKYHGLFTFILIAPLIGFTLFLMGFLGLSNLFSLLYEQSPQLITFAWVLPFLTFFILYQSSLEAYCRVHFKVMAPAIIREVFLKLSNTALVLSYYYGLLNFTQMLQGLIVCYAIAIFMLLVYIKYIKRFYWVWRFDFVHSPYFKEMIKYGLWTVAAGAAATALPHLEKILLPMYQNGLTNNAIFTLALSIGMVISIPKNTVASVSDPILARAWAINDRKEIQTLYTKSALNLSIIGSFLFLGVWTNIDAIFAIIPNSEKYISGKLVVLFIGLASVFDMTTGLNSEILKNSPKYKVEFVLFMVRFGILIAANLILIPIYSIYGAAVAMLLSVAIYNLIKYGYIKYRFGMSPFNYNSLKVLVLAILTYIICQFADWYKGEDFWLNLLEIASKGTIIILIFLGSILYFRISEDLNKIFEKAINLVKTGQMN